MSHAHRSYWSVCFKRWFSLLPFVVFPVALLRWMQLNHENASDFESIESESFAFENNTCFSDAITNSFPTNQNALDHRKITQNSVTSVEQREKNFDFIKKNTKWKKIKNKNDKIIDRTHTHTPAKKIQCQECVIFGDEKSVERTQNETHQTFWI